MSPMLLLVAASAFAEAPPICADRPAKANAVCTVPAGKAQVETGFAGWSLTKDSGTRTTVLIVAPATVKLGLTNSSDLQVSWTPYIRVHARSGGSVSGVGDMSVRYKQRVTSDDAPVQVALIPYVKIPTATHDLGNGKVEGGLAVPISFAMPNGVTITLGPEADVLADSSGNDRHVAIVNLVNVAAPVAPRLTVAGELWSNVNFEPAKTVHQASADAALAYAVTNSVQLDIGANFGLTRQTPDVELYAGVSFRL